MNSFVTRETAFSGEFLPAFVAREGLVSTVNAFVRGEMAFLSKLRRTFHTEVWLLTGVDSFVS